MFVITGKLSIVASFCQIIDFVDLNKLNHGKIKLLAVKGVIDTFIIVESARCLKFGTIL